MTRNINRDVARANAAAKCAEKAARRQRHGKRYSPDEYKTRSDQRSERERVTGNREDTPL